MGNLKKVLIAILAGMLVFSVVGCGNKTDDKDTNTKVENEQDSSVENDDDNIIVNDGVTIETVKNAPETDTSVFKYENVEGGIAIIGYSGREEILVIPEQIDGKNVVEIGEFALAAIPELKGVRIGNNVVRLLGSCFSSCPELEIVICGDGLRIIDEFAFNYCTSLHTVELNEQLEELKMSCLAATDALKEIYIPSSVTTLEYPFIETQTNVTIITEAGSAAEQYANAEGISCEIK